jgi:hypothetical protein
MYCGRCNRAVVAMPGALTDKTWRCPHCLGPAHEGDGPLPSRPKAMLERAWSLIEVVGGLGLLAALVTGGPLPWIIGLGVIAAALLVTAAIRRTDERVKAEPESDAAPRA